MAQTLLFTALALLMIDALIEMGFIATTVSYLHQYNGGQPFKVAGPDNSELNLYAKPHHLEANHGHTSNGAAGTALILVGILGCLVLWYSRRSERSSTKSSLPRIMYLTWVVLTVLSLLLTFSALVYTFVITNHTNDQHISIPALQKSSSRSEQYQLDTWTPETWYSAVLDLPLINDNDRDDISSHLKIIRGWRWNLIPLFLLNLTVCVLAIMGLKTRSQHKQRSSNNEKHLREGETDAGRVI